MDEKNSNPMAFVNIVFGNSNQGISCDIDGNFTITDIQNIDFLRFTYVGYHDTIVKSSSFSKADWLIKMRSKQIILDEVDIFPGENPAHRIVNACVANIKINTPENLSSFSYKAYHKMIFTSMSAAENKSDSISKSKIGISIGISTKPNNPSSMGDNSLDSSESPLEDILSNQHLFIMESVSERKYKRPNKNYEQVLATRMSGLSDPTLVMLANQFQSFSFYNPSIMLLDNYYANPISQGSTKKYFFLLEDTIYQGIDTVFIISFRPFKGKKFDGMSGLLYINSNRYAIQNVVASPADSIESIQIQIQQKYQFMENQMWFPVQLNTNLTFNNTILNGSPLVGIGKSYLKNIEINPPTKGIRYSNIVLKIDPNAAKQTEDYWTKERVIGLDSLELKTYHVIDSIGEAEHLDKKLWVLKSLTNGRIPWGFVDFDMGKFIQLNAFEGFRFGAGIITNDRLSRIVQMGAYGAYATKDQKMKYGADLIFNIWPKQMMKLSLAYQNDVMESASQHNFSKKSIINIDIYRNFLIQKMVYHQSYQSNLTFRALNHFTWSAGFNYSQFHSPDNYQYMIGNASGLYISTADFTIAEANASIRFAFKERIVQNLGSQLSLGTKYPILNIHYSQGIPSLIGSELTYKKFDLQLDYSYQLRYLGKSSWRISAAKALGDLPWYLLYNGKGSYASFYLESPYSFGTMRLNEFLSDEFVAIYFRHDFGSLLFGNKPFVPQPEFVSQFTIGQLSHSDKHKNIDFNTLEKGYYESGVMFNSILKNGLVQLGLGFMYRYGPYSMVHENDNFAYKFTMKFAL